MVLVTLSIDRHFTNYFFSATPEKKAFTTKLFCYHFSMKSSAGTFLTSTVLNKCSKYSKYKNWDVTLQCMNAQIPKLFNNTAKSLRHNYRISHYNRNFLVK